MPDQRVGALDNPGNYGCRSVSVYENRTGYYIRIDGLREKLHGNARWTTTSGLQMKGRARHVQQRPDDDSMEDSSSSDEGNSEDEEEQQIAMAIALSLADGGVGEGMVDVAQAADQDAADDAPEASAADQAGSGSRNCVICLTDDAACMIMRPCNHLCACQGCARRLVNRPCPICRRHVRSVERVFF